VMSGVGWKAESAVRLGELTETWARVWHVNAVEFHDNNFFASEERTAAYCRELLARKLSVRWWAEGRIDTMLAFRPATWALLRDSGLAMVFCGAESGDDGSLAVMDKGGSLSVDKTLTFAQLTASYGIVPEYSFVLGIPSHTHADILSTIRLIRRIKAVNEAVEIVLYRYDPVPLSCRLSDEARRHGFAFPTSLEEWITPYWDALQRRRAAALPWLSPEDVRLLQDFEVVLNAYYPTSTDRRYHSRWHRLLLRLLSGWRYLLGLYRWPLELRLVDHLVHYQRPEVSGF
jgi:anaerobic magnesium-protoporphyrin IX monomethyl ester cyclase